VGEGAMQKGGGDEAVSESRVDPKGTQGVGSCSLTATHQADFRRLPIFAPNQGEPRRS
jgi:hypothetical protein